jgi:hypothetical protein
MRWRYGVALGVGIGGFVLVLGPAVTLFGRDVPLPYGFLYHWVPGFASLRYPYRFGTLTTLALALLAGIGWAQLVGRGRAAWLLMVIALAAIGLEYRQAPLRLVRVEVGDAVPPAYRWLEAHGEGRALLEWPVASPGDLRAGYEQSRAMYFSAYHRLPLVNGYTAYAPPSHELLFLLAQRLPDQRSLQNVIDLSGAQLLLLHRDRLRRDERTRWDVWIGSGGCQQLTEFGADLICALPPQREDRRAELVAANARAPERSFQGLPLKPLSPGAGHGQVVVHRRSDTFPAGLVARLRLTVTNTGTEAWPGLAPLGPGVVVIRHRWQPTGDPAPATTRWRATPILCDLTPGESCDVVLPVTVPRRPGAYLLEIALGQHDGPPFLLDGRRQLQLPVRVVSVRRRRRAR